MQHEVRGCSRQKTVDFHKCDVDKGNVVVFGQQDSYIENTSTGQRIPTNRIKVVFVMQLKAQTSADSTKMGGREGSKNPTRIRLSARRFVNAVRPS